MKQLCVVESIVKRLELGGLVFNNAKIVWYCVDRPRPGVRPEEAVEGYGHLSDSEKFWVQSTLEQLFAEEEANALHRYLSRCSQVEENQITKFDLPLLADSILSMNIFLPVEHRRLLIVAPPWHPELPLPFGVRGYYNMDLMEP